MQKRFALKLVAAVALAAAALTPAMAEQTVKIASIVELSGAGASSGTQFNNGAQLAVHAHVKLTHPARSNVTQGLKLMFYDQLWIRISSSLFY